MSLSKTDLEFLKKLVLKEVASLDDTNIIDDLGFRPFLSAVSGQHTLMADSYKQTLNTLVEKLEKTSLEK